MLVAALSGAFASAAAKMVTYPLETSKTWIMNKKADETVDDVFKQLWKTGFYIGIREKVSKSIVQKFIYFFLFEGLQQGALRLDNAILRSRGKPATTKIRLAALLLSGYLGEALGIPLFAPLEYVAVQVQTSKTREGPVSVVQRTLREKGMRGFYRGWQIYLLCAFQPMLLYPIIERVKALMLAGKGEGAVLTANAAFFLGALSKAVAGTATYPINTVRVIMQASSRKIDDSPKRASERASETPPRKFSKPDVGSTNIFDVFTGIVREEGPLGLYKGLSGELAEGLLGAALQLLVKEKVTDATRMLVYSTKRS